MTQSILMYQRLYHDCQGRRFELNYYLLIDQVIFGCNTLDVYGLRVEHYGQEQLLGQRTLRGVTPFGPRIVTLLNRLANGLVMPDRVEFMLEDTLLVDPPVRP